MEKKRFCIQKSFIPVCVTFGPLFIVIGFNNNKFGLLSYIGCFMLAIGCVMLFKMAVGLENIINEQQGRMQK